MMLSHIRPSTVEMHVAPDWHRWIALAQFCTFNAMTGWQWIMHANITDGVSEYYGCSVLEVNWLSTVYFFAFAITAIVTCPTVKQLGFKKAILLGSTLNTAGAVIKLISAIFYPHYWLLMASQAIGALGQVLALVTPSVVASTWFAEESQTLVTSLVFMSNQCGTGVALLIPPVIVNSSLSLKTAMILVFIVTLVPCVIDTFTCLFFVPRQPVDPPNAVELHRRMEALSGASHEHGCAACGGSYMETVKKLKVGFSNFPLVIVTLAIGLALGSSWAVISFFAQFLKPFGVSAQLAGWMGLINMLAGVLAANMASAIIDRFHTFRLPLSLFLLLTGITTGLVPLLCGIFSSGLAMNILVFIAWTLAGMAINAAVPSALEFAVELSYPFEEEISSGMLMWGSNTLATVLMIILSYTVADGASKATSLLLVSICAGLCAVAAILVALFTNAPLLRQAATKRLEAEQAAKAQPATSASCDGKDNPLTPTTLLVK